MSILTHSPAITFYAAQVRAALDGVPSDIVDELTEGLEADLCEAVLDDLDLDGGAPGGAMAALATLDGEALVARFGSPSRYAADLAAAADVAIPTAPTGVRARPGVREGLARSLARLRTAGSDLLAANSWARSASEGLVAMRPVWWLVRGWALYYLLAGPSGGGDPFPHGVLRWILWLALVVASVQWGRGRFWREGWRSRLALVLSVVAVPAALVGIATAWALTAAASGNDWSSGYSQGVSDATAGLSGSGGSTVLVDGEAATNLFVFGPDGLPIDGAQIVDQAGRPVVLGVPADLGFGSWEEWRLYSGGFVTDQVPLGALDDSFRLNVYPYAFVGESGVRQLSDGSVTLAPHATTLTPSWPMGALLPVPSADASPDASADATADAGAEPTAEPSADATGAGEEATPSGTEATPSGTATP